MNKMTQVNCPKCGTKENPWHIFDYDRKIEFINCKKCNSWFEFKEGKLIPTRKRPYGINVKMVKCPKCGHPINKSILKKQYICTPLGGHIYTK